MYNDRKPLIEAGNLLVYKPLSRIPLEYAYTVILIIHSHENEGSVGFILNYPTQFRVSEALKEFPVFNTNIFVGGYAGYDNIWWIHKKPELQDAIPIGDGTELFYGGNVEQLKHMMSHAEIYPNHIRFCAGHVEWTAGQLEYEIKQGQWLVVKHKNYNRFLFSKQNLWPVIMEKETTKNPKKFPIFKYNFPLFPHYN